jgi:hypothetical protein
MMFRGRKLVAVALAGPLVVGTLAAAVALPVSLIQATAAAASSSSSPPDVTTLYREAIASTHAWSVHYDSASSQSSSAQSNSAQSKQMLVEHGDAGPASGSQTVMMGTGSIAIIVIGGITYVKGNVGGLETLVGLSASQAGQTANQWFEFSSTNAAFAQVVAGVRSSDIAQELALKGPLSLGRPRTISGTAVDAIKGTQKFGHATDHVVLYVRAHGSHVPVEEDSVNAKGQATTAEHIAYSKWGEIVRPRAPQAAASIGPVSAV